LRLDEGAVGGLISFPCKTASAFPVDFNFALAQDGEGDRMDCRSGGVTDLVGYSVSSSSLEALGVIMGRSCGLVGLTFPLTIFFLSFFIQ